MAGPRWAGHPAPEPKPHGGEREHAWLSCRERDEGEHWALHTLGTGDGGRCRASRAVQRPEPLQRRQTAWTDPRADRARATLAVGGKAPLLCRQVQAGGVPVGKARGMRHEAVMPGAALFRETRLKMRAPAVRASEASSGVGGSDPGAGFFPYTGVRGRTRHSGPGPKPAPPRPPARP